MNTRTVAILSLLAGAALVLGPADAHACGGFFCNATTPVPIYQAGERVLFARHDGKTTMHIEVIYSGSPTSFGWVLPMPELPTTQGGEPLPLDQALQLSHEAVFDLVDAATLPQHQSSVRLEEGCSQPQVVPTSASAGDAAAGGINSPPSVQVIEEAAVGPYEARIIQAETADALYAWLSDNGYIQDEAARPVLDYYVGKGYVFLALRLQNGKTLGDLRPIALTLGEQAPCVPLRLTGIAATPDMPIVVFVLGEHRAIPKNHFHAVINPKALDWPNASNYVDVVARGVDQAVGHAFITEMTTQTATLAGQFPSVPAEWFEDKTTPLAILEAYRAFGLPIDGTLDRIVHETIPLLPGSVSAAQLLANPKPYLEGTRRAAEADVAELRRRVIEEVVEPLSRARGLFEATKVLTRFFTVLSPDEMTRDPIFAFNPSLPDVPRTKVTNIEVDMVGAFGCGDGHRKIVYPDGSVHVELCETFSQCMTSFVAPIEGEPPLKVVEVIDESGPPISVSEGQLDMVSAQLGLAEAGQPSLPEGLEVEPAEARPQVTGAVWKLPASDPAWQQARQEGHTQLEDPRPRGSGGCSQSPAMPAGGLALLLLGIGGVLLAWRRRSGALG